MKYQNTIDDQYLELANAIIEHAAMDYRAALMIYKRSLDELADLERLKDLYTDERVLKARRENTEKRKRGAELEIKSIERFFFGEWAQTLTGGVNFHYIIKQLKKEYGINDDHI